MLAIEMKGITKVYPDGTVALRRVDLDVKEAEIHGLLGENGAGKTTLAKILSGLLAPTGGQILVRGQRKDFKNPSEALREGIGMVHQHFTLVPTFNALENIVLGYEGTTSLSVLHLDDPKKKIISLMEETGLKFPIDVPAELLSVGVQQRIEILKLLYRNVGVLILDEPTSMLTPVEVETLFAMLKRLRDAGRTVIFITHKLREVLEVTDGITVLRQAGVAGKLLTAQATADTLAELMVGMKNIPTISRQSTPAGHVVLAVEGLEVRNDFGGVAVKEVSFEVRRGEIFAIAGVEGNGQTELVQAMTGLRHMEKGRVLIMGSDISGMSPRELYKRGVAHIPEDRRKTGLVLDFTVAENSILGIHDEKRFTGRLDRLRWRRIIEFARDLISRFGIVAPSPQARTKTLSGGNQQRLVVGRELVKSPNLIVVAQPTRGLDVAASHYIRELLVSLRDEGKGILLVSADLDEVEQLADKVGVMYEGRIVATANSGELTRKQIGLLMGGLTL